MKNFLYGMSFGFILLTIVSAVTGVTVIFKSDSQEGWQACRAEAWRNCVVSGNFSGGRLYDLGLEQKTYREIEGVIGFCWDKVAGICDDYKFDMKKIKTASLSISVSNKETSK